MKPTGSDHLLIVPATGARPSFRTQVTYQAELAGVQIAYVAEINGSDAELDAFNDIVMARIDRARAHQMLKEALIDLKAAEKTLAQWDVYRAEELKKIADDKARTVASLQASNQTVHGRQPRVELDDGLKPNQKVELQKFDDLAKKRAAELIQDRAALEKKLPLLRAQVERQQLILAGRPAHEVIGFDPVDEPAAAE